MVYIFGLSLHNGIFPLLLKSAIFKKGNKCDISNYRPISLFPQILKIHQKIIATRLTNFPNSNNIINKSRCGFKCNNSTVRAPIDANNFISSSFDKNNFVTGTIFVDLRKALDTVDHNILINKLEHYGLRGVSTDLLRTYLSDRSQ